MFSYRFMTLKMQRNLRNSRPVDAATIVTSEPNPFAAMPGMPPTLRIVPLEMTMDMRMFGMMYAPDDRLTLMLMASYWDKEMRPATYAGGAGTIVLGEFVTKTSGWGDTSLSGLIHLYDTGNSVLHAILGVSLPTGSLEETGWVTSTGRPAG